MDEKDADEPSWRTRPRARSDEYHPGHAADLADARAQWVDAAGRGRPDLGVDAARAQAMRAAAPYAAESAPDRDGADARLGQVLDQLGAAWTEQARAGEQLQWLQPLLARARTDAAQRAQAERILAPLAEQMHTTAAAAQAAEAQAVAARATLQRRAQAVQAALRPDWDTERPVAAEAARTVNAGPGRFGRGRAAVVDAERLLEQWATKWRPVTPELTDPAAAARFAARPPAGDRIQHAIQRYARQRAADQLPQHIQAIRRAEHAARDAQAAADAYQQTSATLSQHQAARHANSGYRDLAEDLPHLSEQTTTTRERLTAAQDRITRLAGHPAIAARPDGETILAAARNTWQTADTHTQAAAERAQRASAQHADQAARRRLHDPTRHGPTYGPPGRDGPSLDR